MLHVLEQQQRRQLVDQHPCLTASRPCCDDDAPGLLVGDNLHLPGRQLPENLVVFLRRDVTLDLAEPFALEILGDELLVVHLEIVLHKPESLIVVSDHEVGILAYDVHLLDFLLVELVEHPVVADFEFRAVLHPMNCHGIVKHEESSFKLHQPNLQQKEECLLHVGKLKGIEASKQGLAALLQCHEQLHDRELHRRI